MTIQWSELTNCQKRVLITLKYNRPMTTYEIMRFCYAYYHDESPLDEFLQAIEGLVDTLVIAHCGTIYEPEWPYDEAQLQYCPTMLGSLVFDREKDRVLAMHNAVQG